MMAGVFRAIGAVALAAGIAGAIAFLPGGSEPVGATTPFDGGKVDRLDVRPSALKCADQTWPYIDAACLRDARGPTDASRSVRIVTTDRLAAR